MYIQKLYAKTNTVHIIRIIDFCFVVVSSLIV